MLKLLLAATVEDRSPLLFFHRVKVMVAIFRARVKTSHRRPHPFLEASKIEITQRTRGLAKRETRGTTHERILSRRSGPPVTPKNVSGFTAGARLTNVVYTED
jgi:hypothetical protein